MENALSSSQLPIVDISKFRPSTPNSPEVEAIGAACRDQGFFYVVGHGVDLKLQENLDRLSREFFSLPVDAKMAIRMELGGRAWRGYFPVGDELTSGIPDAKEGLYFGSDLPADHPMVAAHVPLHGANLYPDIPGFQATVLEYIDAVTQLGHRLMRGIGLSLGLDAGYFQNHYTREPTILFRIFHYPAAEAEDVWGVGEHTDYGLLTILRQDDQGGLQVRSEGRWVEAKPIPNSFVCNIGDMLDRMTGGLYRSTPHRVKNRGRHGRLSFPFFFDPGFDAEVKPLFPAQSTADRWDGTNLQNLSGTYGEYLLSKVSKVFPNLSDGIE